MRMLFPVCLTAVLTASAALAADSATDRVTAAQFYADATAALRSHDFATARSELAQAHALAPTDPEVLWNLAVAEYGLQRYVEACRHIRERLRLTAVTQADREQASELLARMASQVGHLHVTAPEGALVVIDGGRIDRWDDPIEVAPGSHELSARAGDRLKTVTVATGAGEQVFTDLTAEATLAPSAPTAEGPEAFRPPDHVESLPPSSLRSSNVARVAVSASTGAAAVASIIVGGVLLSSANQDREAARSDTTPCLAAGGAPCTSGHNLAQQASDRTNLATGFFIGAGALAAVALATWFVLAPRSRTVAAVWLVPQASPGSAGLAAVGIF